MSINVKISARKIIEYCIITLVVFNSGFALVTGHNRLLFCSQIILIFLLITVNGRYFKVPKFDKRQLIIIIMIISMMVAFIINADFGATLTYVNCMLYILSAYILNIVYGTEVIVKAFIRLMQFVAISGIVVSVLNFIIPFNSYAVIITNGAGVEYYSIGIVNFIADTFLLQPRCCGIFWEPGLYAAFLALTSFLDIGFLHQNNQGKRMILYCIAIFFTYSTAGYIYIIMVLLLVISSKIEKSFGKVILVLIGGLLIVISLNINEFLELLAQWSPDVFSKIINKNQSYMTRVVSPLTDLYIIMQNIFGVGFGNIQAWRLSAIQSLGANISLSTSTLTYHGACCGIMFLFAYNVAWISNISNINKNRVFKILGYLIFGMVLTANPMYNNQMIWTLIFMDFSKELIGIGQGGETLHFEKM